MLFDKIVETFTATINNWLFQAVFLKNAKILLSHHMMNVIKFQITDQ